MKGSHVGKESAINSGHAIALLSLAVCFVVAAPAQAFESNNRCGFATMIVVRGTSAPPGAGSGPGDRTYASGGVDPTLSVLTVQANQDSSLPIHIESLKYPAVALPSGAATAGYVSSVQVGVNNLVGEINDLIANCPGINILLAGYSQGADVIDNAIGLAHQAAYSVPTLDRRAYTQVSATVLIADPGFRSGEKWDAGSFTKSGVWPKPANQFGPYTRLSGAQVKSTVYSLCYAHDFYCQADPGGLAVHPSYGTWGAMYPAWLFMRETIYDNG